MDAPETVAPGRLLRSPYPKNSAETVLWEAMERAQRRADSLRAEADAAEASAAQCLEEAAEWQANADALTVALQTLTGEMVPDGH